MLIPRQKQLTLKPQDLLVALKIAANEHRHTTYAELGKQLSMSASEVYAASQRAELCRLITRKSGALEAVRPALQEFILHGVKYVFPALQGGMARGMSTGAKAQPLKDFFSQGDALGWVWPDPLGEEQGLSIQPLYPSVPAAARADHQLYQMLVLVDALRAGAAREREIAASEFIRRLS